MLCSPAVQVREGRRPQEDTSGQSNENIDEVMLMVQVCLRFLISKLIAESPA